jgi:peptide-methionine (S)-S-oxide reductase
MYLHMKKPLLATLAAAGIAGAILFSGAAQGARAVVIPAVKTDVPAAPGLQTAVLAGGCFWTMEAVFEHVKGVKSVTAGYAGGTRDTARHAEAIRIAYDPRIVSYGTLLRVYFSIAHDPTSLNRQGPDSGTSYRSAIFPQSPVQAQVARAYIGQLGATHVFADPIVTKLETGAFYPAEAYHQNFFDRNPTHPYIVMWDKPKLAAFRAAFPTISN